MSRRTLRKIPCDLLWRTPRASVYSYWRRFTWPLHRVYISRVHCIIPALWSLEYINTVCCMAAFYTTWRVIHSLLRGSLMLYIATAPTLDFCIYTHNVALLHRYFTIFWHFRSILTSYIGVDSCCGSWSWPSHTRRCREGLYVCAWYYCCMPSYLAAYAHSYSPCFCHSHSHIFILALVSLVFIVCLVITSMYNCTVFILRLILSNE